jgi:ABC-type transport system involved in cytochrome bd biosynthesis fused ATPase/permease subunit
MWAGVAAAIVVALIIGFICFRLRGPYFVLASIAAAETSRLTALNLKSFTNGVGRSTTLRNISRLLKPDSGSITFAGTNLNQLEPHEIVERGIVRVPEGRKIFSELTVMENLRMGPYAKSAKKDHKANIDWVFSLFPREGKGRNSWAAPCPAANSRCWPSSGG